MPFYLGLLSLTTLLPGFFLVFEDSEIWGITSSRRLIENPLEITSAHFKPLFSLIFGTVTKFASSDWNALIDSRFVMILIAAVGLLSFYSFGVRQLNAERRPSVTFGFYALFATMPLLILHFTKVRSDSASASVVLTGMFLLSYFESRSLRFKGLIYFIAGIAAIALTPKSIDLFLVLMIVFWSVSRNESKDRRLIWLTLPIAAPLLFALLFTRELILRSLLYWYDSYESVRVLSLIPWVSVSRSIEAAPLASLFTAISIFIGIYKFKRLSWNEKVLVLTGAIVGLFIVIHSQKFLFFLSSRAPFFALAALPGFHELVAYAEKRFHPRTVLRGILSAIALSLILTTVELQRYPGFQISFQRAVLQSLESYLDRARPHSYWDGIGLFPKRNQVFHYPSPDDRNNADLLAYVDVTRPSLILRTSKMELLEPMFMMWLQDRYAKVSDQIYARFAGIPATPSCLLDVDRILEITKAQNVDFPLALFVVTPTIRSWVRMPFKSKNGIERKTLDLKTMRRGKIVLPNCNQQDVWYAVMEAGPWDALPAPAFSPFFGYDGNL